MKLCELAFSDLCVAETIEVSWYKATPDSLITKNVPAECMYELVELRKLLTAQAPGDDFRVTWPPAAHELAIGADAPMPLRVERIAISDDKLIFICRRFRVAPSSLPSLGIPPAVASRLMEPELINGLVVFLGRAGSGKTTTAGSFVVERLSKFGGVCWTIENPIELPLQGRHGHGVCYQTEIASDDEIGNRLCRIYRATPNIILIGELRNGYAVREAITAAMSGHLVVTTFHSNDLIGGLARLTRLAGTEDVKAALADTLRVGIHVSLHNAQEHEETSELAVQNAKGTGAPPRVLSVQPLWVRGPTEDQIRSTLRGGDFHMLTSEVERQRRSLMMMQQELP